LVVYVEAADLNRLTDRARGEGRTVVEWVRETLLGQLDNNTGLPWTEPVRLARRGSDAEKRISGVARKKSEEGVEEGSSSVCVAEGVGDARGTKKAVSSCKHGVAKGWHCWQCGGMAVIDAHD